MDTPIPILDAPPIHETREEWLLELARFLGARLRELSGPDLPQNIRLACGWPDGPGNTRVLAACYSPDVSRDGHFEVFVSPVLDDPARVADATAHEIIHAIHGIDEGHGARFEATARLIGLDGPPTATVAGPGFLAWWAMVAPLLGAYPHAAMSVPEAPQGPVGPIGKAPRRPRGPTRIGGPKPQTSRLVRAHCPGCGYVIRTTRVWLAKGLPICVCGVKMIEG